MAILGLQLVTTLVAATVLSKVISVYSFTYFLIKNLKRYSVPTDEQLLGASGSCKLKNKNKKRRNELNHNFSNSNGNYNGQIENTFFFPRSTTIHLDYFPVLKTDVYRLPLYSNLQWLIDFSVCTGCVYFINEIVFNCVIPWQESWTVKKPNGSNSFVNFFNARFNLSLIWICLNLWFVLRCLISINAIYFRSNNNADSVKNGSKGRLTKSNQQNQGASVTATSDWMLIFGAAFIFLVAAGIFLTLDKRIVDFGLQQAHRNFTLDSQMHSSSPLISWGTFQAILAFCASLIGSLFVYPGFKYGKLYLDAVRYSSRNANTSVFRRFTLHVSLVSPLIPILLWLRPITDHFAQSMLTLTHNATVSQTPLLLVVINFLSLLFTQYLDNLRIFSCLFVIFIRLWTIGWILQAYLDSAQERLDRCSHEPGDTSNVEVQRQVASIFYCLNLVILQCITPIILIGSFVCLYKNAIGISWFAYKDHRPLQSALPSTFDYNQLNLFTFVTNASSDQNMFQLWSSNLVHLRSAFGQFIDFFSIRTLTISQSVLGFLTWWTMISWQSVNLVGLAYHRFALE